MKHCPFCDSENIVNVWGVAEKDMDVAVMYCKSCRHSHTKHKNIELCHMHSKAKALDSLMSYDNTVSTEVSS